MEEPNKGLRVDKDTKVDHLEDKMRVTTPITIDKTNQMRENKVEKDTMETRKEVEVVIYTIDPEKEEKVMNDTIDTEIKAETEVVVETEIKREEIPKDMKMLI